MRASTEKIAFSTACAIALASGAFLGSGRLRPMIQTAWPMAGSEGSPRKRSALEALVEKSALKASVGSVPRAVLLRRTLSACETAALWQWLENDPEDVDGYIKFAVVQEIVDRLGWGAWQQAVGIGDPALRERLGSSILQEFARRDPWKAFSEWKKHREIFQNNQAGNGVIAACTSAAAAVSADRLIEMFQQIPLHESHEVMNVAFANDFDFRKVLDHLVTSGSQPFTVTGNLMPEWAKRSPVEAAEWLASHQDYLETEYREGEAGGTLRSIADAKMDETSRRRALDAMAGLKPEILDQAWRQVGESSDGKVSAQILASADLAGRREDYLRLVLMETRTEEHFDPSWKQVPLNERLQVLAAAEREWAEKEPLPVDAKARVRWEKRVKAAWGITP